MADEVSKAIIDTLIAEAAGQGEESMRRVAETILNRSAIRNLTPEQVVMQANQYTGYSNPGPGAVRSQNNPAVRALAEAAWRTAMEPGDPTGGADHYYAPGTISQPSWARGMTPTGQYGGHNYYSSRPIPPGEIPNTVATALSVTPTPRVAPSPVTISPDLAQMRNPIMSSSARNAQVTPTGNVPLPRNRPSAPDIVTPTMASLARPAGNVNATRAVDMIAATQNPVTPRLTAAGDDIYSYHIPDMTPTTVTGGIGSLTPTPARVRLPELPPSNIGQPPITRSVQSVPFTSTPTSSMPRPNSAQINDAARRAALISTQGNVERAVPAARPIGSASSNINNQRSEQLGQRVATNIPARLSPGVAAQAYDVALNGPAGLTRQQFSALPLGGVVPATPQLANVPLPRVRPDMPPVAVPRPQQSPPIMAQSAPLRITVNGANSYSAQQMTPVQALQARGLSPSAAYESANASARGAPSVEDRVRGETSSGSGDRLVSMPLASNQLFPLLSGSSFVSRYG